MIKNKQKLITIGALLIIMLLLSGFNAFKQKEITDTASIESVSELAGKTIGGQVFAGLLKRGATNTRQSGRTTGT